ncbi:MAG TPA: O-antigen ligase family protein, partial [Pyrinomonadaceae bacterium]|nr:O-antigen ligase family protein [Pyrinomonadaceae bacterium]
MAAAAPHSIAVSQTFWLLGITLLAARLAVGPRPRLRFSAIDGVLIAFVAWSVLSAALSYEPAISLDKLRSVGLFLVFYLARGAIASPRGARLVLYVLIISCMVNVIWTPLERIIGRGVEVHGIITEGPLGRNGMLDGDTILRVNGSRVGSAEELIAALQESPSAEIVYHRPDADKRFQISAADLAPGASPVERLGIGSWQPNRVWRAKGFYGHFTTYSEVLQLIASLVLGLGLAGAAAWKSSRPRADVTSISPTLRIAVFAGAFLLISVALLLSGTRASQLGLLVSGIVMVATLGSRKMLIAMLLAAIPVAAAGYFALQQTRQQDETNEYRITMWRDGARLATESSRHMLVGVGMDSIKERW